MKICAIVAMDDARVIGKDNTLPWRIPEDMKRVSALTTGNTVVMGRKTYESLPDKFRPLPNRLNIVVSRTASPNKFPSDVRIVSEIEGFLTRVRSGQETLQGDTLWVFGGAEIYRVTEPFWDAVFLTRVQGVHDGDTFFPAFERNFTRVSVDQRDGYSFEEHQRQR